MDFADTCLARQVIMRDEKGRPALVSTRRVRCAIASYEREVRTADHVDGVRARYRIVCFDDPQLREGDEVEIDGVSYPVLVVRRPGMFDNRFVEVIV